MAYAWEMMACAWGINHTKMNPNRTNRQHRMNPNVMNDHYASATMTNHASRCYGWVNDTILSAYANHRRDHSWLLASGKSNLPNS
jgi:hypothetical protein